MKVRIGALEILDPTWEELAELVNRFGGAIVGDQAVASATENGDPPHPPSPQRKNCGGVSTSDRVVLEQLVAAGSEGLPTQSLGEILGRQGKSIRPGLMEWARRIGLTNDANVDPFQEVRVGTRRGARLKDSLQHVAKELLKTL
jgi:hypothetical protein